MAIPSYTQDLVNSFSGSGSSNDGFEGLLITMIVLAFSVLLILEFIVAARTIIFKGRYDGDLALHIFVEWAKGALVFCTFIASPLALKFWFGAVNDAFTVNFISTKH